MGKFIIQSEFDKEVERSGKFIFKVRYRKGKEYHTEKFSIGRGQYLKAKEMGILKFNNKGYATYLDWKPIGGAKGITGGIKKVEFFKRDDKYLYAVTKNKTYSLPLYLEKHVNRYDYILFGKREY